MIYKLLNAIQLYGVNVNSPKYTSFLETYKSILKAKRITDDII